MEIDKSAGLWATLLDMSYGSDSRAASSADFSRSIPGSIGIVLGTVLLIVDLPELDAPNDHLPSM
jgi:hypothetical protein